MCFYNIKFTGKQRKFCLGKNAILVAKKYIFSNFYMLGIILDTGKRI